MALNIDGFLSDGENVLAEYKSKKQKFYATDRRLIWTQRGNFIDASYNHVNSISMHMIKYKGLIVLGAILFLIGIAILTIGSTAGIVLIVFGIIFIILYLFYKKSIYTLSLSSGEKIPIPKTKASNAEAFIKVVRDKVR